MKAKEMSRDVGASPTHATGKHKEKIPRISRSVKPGWLNQFLVRCEASRTEVVETVRLSFPNFDKALLSKCEHPEKYGVQLTPKAKKLLNEAFTDRKDGDRCGNT